MSGGMLRVFVEEPLHADAITARGCLRVWTAPGQSHLIPSGWLMIPENGWLVIECR
jgi:hypothetical protein